MTIFEQLIYISSGIGVTFRLIPLVLIFSLICGCIIGVVQFQRVPILSRIIDLYILIMRGIPPLVVILLLFYTLNMRDQFASAVVCLTVYHSAYVAEIVRGGFEAIPRGQMMAGESLGLKYWTIMLRIYIPQVALHIIPALCGQAILVIKDSTLVSVVGLEDIMWATRQLVTITFNPMLAYLLIFILYYLICFVVEIIGNRVEKALSKSVRVLNSEVEKKNG